jgi:hypothetical protein
MKILSLIVFLSVLFAAQTSFAQTKKLKSIRQTLKISQIKEQKPQEGIFITQGFIAKIYVCPPCPKGLLCKPCMGNNIVISEDKKNLETFDLTSRELIIFVKDAAKKMVKGKQYSFTVKLTARKSTSEPLNDVELISYKSIQ